MAQSSDSISLLDISKLNHLKGTEIGIIATEWNENIVAEQIAGAKRIADKLGIIIKHIKYVPGCVEIPFAVKKYYEKHTNAQPSIAAIIAFGAVVRGDTPHFDYVCNMVSNGIAQLNLKIDIPVVFGVLTVNTNEQAWERLGGKHGHKGEEAMITALKMIDFQLHL
jgi:6,7-dimethyl-8-ribityllumazine synthase